MPEEACGKDDSVEGALQRRAAANAFETNGMLWEHEPRMLGLRTFQEKPEIQIPLGKCRCFNAEHEFCCFLFKDCAGKQTHTHICVLDLVYRPPA